MITFVKNHLPIIWVIVLVTMLVLSWLYPSSRFVIEAAFLIVSFALASFLVLAKNRESYQQGKLAQGAFVGHSIFDVFSIVLAMAAAGLLANSIAQIMNVQVGGNLVRILAVIAVSLLAGISIGMLMRRIRRYILTPSQRYGEQA